MSRVWIWGDGDGDVVLLVRVLDDRIGAKSGGVSAEDGIGIIHAGR